MIHQSTVCAFRGLFVTQGYCFCKFSNAFNVTLLRNFCDFILVSVAMGYLHNERISATLVISTWVYSLLIKHKLINFHWTFYDTWINLFFETHKLINLDCVVNNVRIHLTFFSDLFCNINSHSNLEKIKQRLHISIYWIQLSISNLIFKIHM